LHRGVNPFFIFAFLNNHSDAMHLSIGCDHAGYTLKEELVRYLSSLGHSVHDLGTHSAESVDYPDFAHAVARDVAEKKSDRGIVICGSGNGVAMAANKNPEIRCALCWTPELAALARQHNNANMLSIPARFVDTSVAHAMARIFLETPFEGGRHAERVRKISC
jgi:ribose 5-phosphate isomerase B